MLWARAWARSGNGPGAPLLRCCLEPFSLLFPRPFPSIRWPQTQKRPIALSWARMLVRSGSSEHSPTSSPSSSPDASCPPSSLRPLPAQPLSARGWRGSGLFSRVLLWPGRAGGLPELSPLFAWAVRESGFVSSVVEVGLPRVAGRLWVILMLPKALRSPEACQCRRLLKPFRQGRSAILPKEGTQLYPRV